MTGFRNPDIGKAFEEIAEIAQGNEPVANVLQTILQILCGLDMRLAKLEGIPLVPEPVRPHHAQTDS
jgi:hypothetical protein